MNQYELATKRNDLAELQPEIKTRLGRDFPRLYYDELAVIDTPTDRVVIDDLTCKAEKSIKEELEFLFLACKGQVISYDVRRQGQILRGKIERLLTALDPKRTLVLFPGDGAQAVREQLPEELLAGLLTIDLPVQREVDKQTKAVKGVKVWDITKTRKEIANRKVTTILVLDDVIMSTATLWAVCEAFPTRNAEWFAGSLFMLSPVQNKGRASPPCGVAGYKSILVPTVYQGTRGIPAVNSLSTLIGTSGKSQAVKERYMADYVEDQNMFMEMVYQLRQVMPPVGI